MMEPEGPISYNPARGSPPVGSAVKPQPTFILVHFELHS